MSRRHATSADNDGGGARPRRRVRDGPQVGRTPAPAARPMKEVKGVGRRKNLHFDPVTGRRLR